MGKKITIYFIAFIALFLVNILVFLKLKNHTNREAAIQNILAEIENQNPAVSQFNNSSAPFATDSLKTEALVSDGRSANLKAWFRKHNSPLYDFADVIVRESDKNDFDYRLLPAIAMQESTLCRAIPEDSHNCWGWGIYNTTVTRFDSYEVAIETVAAGLKKEYIDKGLVTASAIMDKYTPSSKGSWAYGVNTFLRALE